MAHRYRHDSHSGARGEPRARTPYREPRRSHGSTPRAISTKSNAKPPQPPSGGLFSAKLVAAIFFVFVFVYVGHAIWAFWTPTIDTMILRMSTIDVHYSATGIIIRDEHVHFADRDGYIDFHVPDNEWVAVGTVIASVGDSYMVDAATVRLASVENQAMDIQNRRLPMSIMDSEVQRLNNSLTNIVNARIHSFTTLNLSEINALHDQLNQQIDNRNQININDGVAAAGMLAREQDRHMAVLTYNSRNMYASTTGIMSRIIDGRETILTRASVNELTREDILANAYYDPLAITQDVQEGDGAFKIVGNVWYIVAEMPNAMLTGFEEDSIHTVYLYNETRGEYEAHSLRVQSIDYSSRYSLVVFRSTRHVINFISQRNVSIRTTSGVQRGLKLPDTAIVSKQYYRIPMTHIHDIGELEPFVLVSTEGGNNTVPVEIANTTEYYAYIAPASGLGAGSLLVPSDPHSVHMLLTQDHMQELHGVFVDSLGLAEFRLINLAEGSIAVGYILLDPALNPGIREFANIVIDASSVTEGQLIR